MGGGQRPDSSAERAKGSGLLALGPFLGQKPPPHPRRAAPSQFPERSPAVQVWGEVTG